MDISEPADQVPRLHRFEAEHPEWQIISPSSIRSQLRDETDWRAAGPGGRFVRAFELRELLDELENPAAGPPPPPE